MNSDIISDYYSLQLRLQALKADRKVIEALIVRDLDQIRGTIDDPAPLIKRALKGLSTDKDFKNDLLKTGINLAYDFIVNRFLKGTGQMTVLDLLAEKFSKKNGSPEGESILDNITRMFRKKQ
jgi:hypothetical protein